MSKSNKVAEYVWGVVLVLAIGLIRVPFVGKTEDNSLKMQVLSALMYEGVVEDGAMGFAQAMAEAAEDMPDDLSYLEDGIDFTEGNGYLDSGSYLGGDAGFDNAAFYDQLDQSFAYGEDINLEAMEDSIDVEAVTEQLEGAMIKAFEKFLKVDAIRVAGPFIKPFSKYKVVAKVSYTSIKDPKEKIVKYLQFQKYGDGTWLYTRATSFFWYVWYLFPHYTILLLLAAGKAWLVHKEKKMEPPKVNT